MTGRQLFVFAASDAMAYCYHYAMHHVDSHHMQHHRDPQDSLTLRRASLVSGVFIIAASSSFRLGVLPLGYWSAITCMHPLMHSCTFTWWPMAYLQRRHRLHHERGDVNYGPIFPFIDMLCGTESY